MFAAFHRDCGRARELKRKQVRGPRQNDDPGQRRGSTKVLPGPSPITRRGLRLPRDNVGLPIIWPAVARHGLPHRSVEARQRRRDCAVLLLQPLQLRYREWLPRNLRRRIKQHPRVKPALHCFSRLTGTVNARWRLPRAAGQFFAAPPLLIELTNGRTDRRTHQCLSILRRRAFRS